MRGLLDVNVLLALFDGDHAFHERAHEWIGNNPKWASCPLTENGLVRIMAHPNYHPVKRHAVSEVIRALGIFADGTEHAFWADDRTLRDSSHVDAVRILGPRTITDVYLLALATHQKGRLVTFDEGINLSAVPGAKAANLCVIP